MPPALQAAILGVIQGLTEFLPVSSTAHLLIFGRLLGHDDPGGVFTVLIQLGSIVAVMWLYRARLVEVVRGLPSSPAARRFVAMIALACVPALAAGALLAGYVKSVLYNRLDAMAVAFIAGGIAMIVLERYRRTPVVRDIDQLSAGRALGIGLCQMLALIPGVSRSGATILGGLAVGLDRRAAAEFSFFLAMPTMAAAFAHDLYEAQDYMTMDRGVEIGIGLVMAFVASLLVMKPFLAVVTRSGFAPFAFYRIALGLVLIGAIAAGWSLT
jgi:undecaprenyl-diphosphatase